MGLSKLNQYEAGMLGDLETLEFFSNLIATGQCWNLQGHYSRTAEALISDNWINPRGEINHEKVDANESYQSYFKTI